MRRKVSKQLEKKNNRKYRRQYSRKGFAESQQPKYEESRQRMSAVRVAADRMIAFAKVIKWGHRRKQAAMIQEVNYLLKTKYNTATN